MSGLKIYNESEEENNESTIAVSTKTKQLYETEHVSQEFLEAAEVYSQSQQKVNELRHRLRMEEEKKKEYYTVLVSKCKHKYEAQPREYQSPREWICSICKHTV